MTDKQGFNFGWNYRVVNAKSENGGEDWYCLKEVFYVGSVPMGYSDPCVGSDDMESLKRVWEMMGNAMKAPPMQEEDFVNKKDA